MFFATLILYLISFFTMLTLTFLFIRQKPQTLKGPARNISKNTVFATACFIFFGVFVMVTFHSKRTVFLPFSSSFHFFVIIRRSCHMLWSRKKNKSLRCLRSLAPLTIQLLLYILKSIKPENFHKLYPTNLSLETTLKSQSLLRLQNYATCFL